MVACQNEPIDVPALVEQRLQEKFDKVRFNKLKTCRENALQAANDKVDSTISKNALDKLEMLKGKPTKPSIPESLTVVDTVPLRPLWDTLPR